MSVKSVGDADQEPRGMKPREFALRYGLSEFAVYQGCGNGSIPSIRVGNRLVILWREWEKKANV
jgi:hypothetical protein